MEAIVYYYFVILFGNIQQCGAIGTCFNSWFVWAGRVGFFLNANKIEKSKELWVLPSSKDFLNKQNCRKRVIGIDPLDQRMENMNKSKIPALHKI